jgi:hypothetical protein
MYIVIVLHFTQNMYRKKYTSEFRTYEENKYKENKKQNKCETKPISTRFVVQLIMTTRGARAFTRQCVWKCADWARCPLHYTHINYLCPIQVLLLRIARLGTLSTTLHTHQLFVSDTSIAAAYCKTGHVVHYTTHTSTVCIRYKYCCCVLQDRARCPLHYTHINCLYPIQVLLMRIARPGTRTHIYSFLLFFSFCL